MANYFGTPWRLDTANAGVPFWNGRANIKSITYFSAAAGNTAVIKSGNPASPNVLLTLVGTGNAAMPAVWQRLDSNTGIENPILDSMTAGGYLLIDVE